MTNVKNITFGASRRPVYPESTWTKRFANYADASFSAPHHIGEAMDKQIKNAPNGVLGTAYKKSLELIKWFGTRAVSFDFHEFPRLGKSFVSEPPIGALILLLYPFTVGPRIYRAWERGKKNNDYREIYDVLRRDLTAITIFLFLLKPFIKKIADLKEKYAPNSIKTLYEQGGAKELFNYSQYTQNLEMINAETLEYIIKNGDGKALMKAASAEMLTHGLPKGMPVPNQLIEEFQTRLRAAVDTLGHPESIALKNACKDAFGVFQKLETQLPQAKNFVSRHARTGRLWIDLPVFLATCVLIGWFPVWFNDMWNQIKYAEKRNASQNQPGTEQERATMFAALRQSSQLAR